MSRPVKRGTAVGEQIALLRDRGMCVETDLAEQWLSHVSYYRLSAYWYPARLLDGTGRRSDMFRPGTSFADAAALYEADRKLRTLTHDGVERIEVAMRTKLISVLCDDDPLAYRDPACFRPSFDHRAWLQLADKRIRRAGRRNRSIQHYRTNYGGEYPFWVLAEVLDFADVSRLFEGLPAKSQRPIAESLGITIELDRLSPTQRRKATGHSPLARWLEQFTVIRNACAHHARLWNSSFVPAPTAAMRQLPGCQLLPPGQSERIFGALTVMAQLLRVISPGTTWPVKAADLVTSSFLPNPLVAPAALGIPADWNGAL